MKRNILIAVSLLFLVLLSGCSLFDIVTELVIENDSTSAESIQLITITQYPAIENKGAVLANILDENLAPGSKVAIEIAPFVAVASPMRIEVAYTGGEYESFNITYDAGTSIDINCRLYNDGTEDQVAVTVGENGTLVEND